MRAIYFEPFSGASGDMILGALIALGASEALIRQYIEPAANVSFRQQKVMKGGISATDVTIVENKPNNERHFSEICAIVSSAGLPAEVEKDALAIFKIIAEAESKIHNQPLEKLHFHETGQDDAIADVIGACLAFYDLKSHPQTSWDEIICNDINVGGGFVECCHGTLPVPAPATLEILKNSGLPFYSKGNRELLTPTGAAILSHFASPAVIPTATSAVTPTATSAVTPTATSAVTPAASQSVTPAAKTILIGYGAGKAETKTPNVLRVSLIESSGCPPLQRDSIEVLETNVDDVTGEVLGNLAENLMAMGALDVAVIPIYMKKGRPAHLIQVISKPETSEKLARQIIRETGSLGVRVAPSKHRVSVSREIVSIEVDFAGKVYTVPLKVAKFPEGEVVQISAEYENCKRISAETGIPLREVLSKAEYEGRNKYWRNE
ncbi:MAG: LarC family nickel insertion protein [Methanimicrococcus sp.]|nr:LarC family nickel insertion protein [Methanimicrococcus sp.]